MFAVSFRILASIGFLLASTNAFAQSATDGGLDDTAAPPAISKPTLRTAVTVSSDLVRVGDFVDNAGANAQVALFRAPDLGTTGSVPVSDVMAALRNHGVIGVDYPENTIAITVTRAARTIATKQIEQMIARTFEHHNGLGDAADLQIQSDRELRTQQLDLSASGDPQAVASRYDSRTGRFDVTYEIATSGGAPVRLRFTGAIVETAEVAMVTRMVDRGETLRASDIVFDRRPKAEVPNDTATQGQLIGMMTKRALRPGQPLRTADIAKPQWVQRDQEVTITFDAPGLSLTVRGKANESGTQGDVVSITNLQSKRIVQGVVIAPGQVSISPLQPRMTASAELPPSTAPVTGSANE
jgi:flagellar basal body P-ring formation protein FlgA